jgi:hypothetical protein
VEGSLVRLRAGEGQAQLDARRRRRNFNGASTMNHPEAVPSAEDDWAEHQRTYRGFVKGVLIFAAHVLAILLILAWVFADSLSTPPIS